MMNREIDNNWLANLLQWKTLMKFLKLFEVNTTVFFSLWQSSGTRVLTLHPCYQFSIFFPSHIKQEGFSIFLFANTRNISNTLADRKKYLFRQFIHRWYLKATTVASPQFRSSGFVPTIHVSDKSTRSVTDKNGRGILEWQVQICSITNWFL